MSDKKDSNQTEDLDNKNNNSSIDQSRRKFTQASFAAPIVMSLASQPVWGAECTLSGFMSGNVSGHVHECGRGCTPGFWKNNYEAWATTDYSPGNCIDRKPNNTCAQWNAASGTTFSYVFGFNPTGGDAATTMMEVLLKDSSHGSANSYESHLIAFALNASSNPTEYGSTLAQLDEAFQAIANGNISQSDLFELIVTMNERGQCFLNSRGECQGAYLTSEDGCLPACGKGDKYDYCSQNCVPVDTPGAVFVYADYIDNGGPDGCP